MATKIRVLVEYSSGRTEQSGEMDRRTAAQMIVGIEQSLRRSGYTEQTTGVWTKGKDRAEISQEEIDERREQYRAEDARKGWHW